RLREGGYGTPGAVLDAELTDLAAVDGVGTATALALREWAQGELDHAAEPAEGDAGGPDLNELAARAEKGPKTMADADFMAALSRAFQDLDVTQGEGDGEAAAEPVESEKSEDN
ncbi:MAG TPA: hypothetical protein VN811_09375, partial [Thermoanaerobaculia bacterium]|nr:hypothetical protein [Thermoanaerobaculia bacterium]